jgi:hypothetical protein
MSTDSVIPAWIIDKSILERRVQELEWQDEWAKSVLRNLENLLKDAERRVQELEGLEPALQRIATPKRPDGTYNLGREACEQIARAALEAARKP